MRPFSSAAFAPLAALALLWPLAGCGGGSDSENALSSLDQRLANGAAPDNGAAGESGEASRTTLGQLAERQQGGARSAMESVSGANGAALGGCVSQAVYGDHWAREMPAPFTLYPGARLVEAAAVAGERCALRVISFTTPDAPGTVIAHYAARARDAGFDAAREQCEDELRLGGVRARDDTAYVVFAREAADGRTEVDIVASLAS